MVLLLLATLQWLGVAACYGFGIDWGSEYHKSTILIPEGGFRMVENDISKRKTPSMLSFCGKDRFLESQAQVKFARQNCQTFYHMNRFFAEEGSLADFADHPLPIEDQFSFIFPAQADAFALHKRTKSQKLALANGADLPDYYIRFEEILAMMMQREKKNAATTGGGSYAAASFAIWDNSLSIPTRKQILAAMRLAGLKPLGFIHENVAALVYLSMDRVAEKETREERVLVVNVGANGVKLSLSKFEPFTELIKLTKQTKILPAVTNVKDSFSTDFSGRMIDECIAGIAIQKLPEARRKGLPQGLKTVQKRRLMAEANKAKEMLSANKEYSFIIEDFFEDANFNVKIARTDFEAGCQTHFEKFEKILREFLSGQDPTKVEGIGGIVRVPKVQEIIKAVTKLPLGSRINGDEGPAMGAALFAANNTSGLKLKKIILNDGPNYSVDLNVAFSTGDKPDKTAELFPLKTNYGTSKKINIKQLASDLKITLTVTPGNYTMHYNISGVEKTMASYAKKVVDDWKGLFTFELDAFGIPKLAKAELIIKENVTETVNKTLPKSNKTSNASDNSSAPNYTLETKHSTQVRTEKLTITLLEQTYKSLHEDKELFFDSSELLKAFNEKEDKERLIAKLRNKLESYVYLLKSTATDSDSAHFLSQTEAETFRAKSDEIEEFLFDSTVDQKAIEKMTFEADKLMDIFRDRKTAKDQRVDTWKKWHDFIRNATVQFGKLKQEKPWVAREEFDGLLAEINTAKEKIDGLHEEQKTLPANQDPVFRLELVQNKINDITERLGKISRTPKPKNDTSKTEKKDKETPKEAKKAEKGEESVEEL